MIPRGRLGEEFPSRCDRVPGGRRCSGYSAPNENWHRQYSRWFEMESGSVNVKSPMHSPVSGTPKTAQSFEMMTSVLVTIWSL
jgi:hypothetical protein